MFLRFIPFSMDSRPYICLKYLSAINIHTVFLTDLGSAYDIHSLINLSLFPISNVYHLLPQFSNFQLDFIRHYLLFSMRQQQFPPPPPFACILKNTLFCHRSHLSFIFSNRNIWGLIKTIKKAVKKSLVKPPAAIITEQYFP